MRIASWLSAGAALLWAWAASAAEPAAGLTVLFTGDNFGQIEPCG